MAKEKLQETESQDSNEVSEPKKKSGLKLGSLPVWLGIIVGTLIIIIVSVRFIFLPYLVENLNGANPKDTAKVPPKPKTWEETFTVTEKLSQFYETGRITTNPKASTQFVVVNLGIVFYPRNDDALKLMKEEKAKEPKEKNEGAQTILPTQEIAKIKGAITGVLGSMSVDEIQGKRESISEIFKSRLYSVFKSKDLFLKEVIVQEFILQD